MTTEDQRTVDARADRRVALIALAIMFGLVLSGVGFAAFYASTSCRHIERPTLLTQFSASETGPAARAQLVAAGLQETAIDAAESVLGPVMSTVELPLSAPQRLGPAPTGIGAVLVTGDGAAVIAPEGEVTAAATYRRPVTVVGDGVTMFALVVGNTRTGQVDALVPLTPTVRGLESGACVDTSAVGSPLSFVHDARDGNLLGLRTDEDGTRVVIELRDHVRGRVWAPALELPRAPAGLQGSRTSGALGPDVAVVARRAAPTGGSSMPLVVAFDRVEGTVRWALEEPVVLGTLPAALANEPALRLEVAHVDAERAVLVVFPDVAPNAPLPRATFGPLGDLMDVPDGAVTLTLDVATGAVSDVAVGPPTVDRDGEARGALRAELQARGVQVDDVMASRDSTWVLVGTTLARFAG